MQTSDPAARPGRSGGRLWAFLNERLGLSAFAYPVPAHANTLGYSLGGLTLASLLVLVLTGFLLAQYYNPLPTGANQSVRYIMQQAPLGWFIRSLHYWAAQVMVATLLLHLIRVVVTAAYKRPREVNYLVGVALFAVTLGF